MGHETGGPYGIEQDVERYALRTTLTVPASPTVAFTRFTDGLADWWVREYTWSGPKALREIGIEPGPGGMAYEIGPHGFRSDWGRVLVWEPPHLLTFTWQIGPDRAPLPDPALASEVEVRFVADNGNRTRVTVEHRHFDRHGADAEGYRKALTAGWLELLTRYALTMGPLATGPLDH